DQRGADAEALCGRIDIERMNEVARTKERENAQNRALRLGDVNFLVPSKVHEIPGLKPIPRPPCKGGIAASFIKLSRGGNLMPQRTADDDRQRVANRFRHRCTHEGLLRSASPSRRQPPQLGARLPTRSDARDWCGRYLQSPPGTRWRASL